MFDFMSNPGLIVAVVVAVMVVLAVGAINRTRTHACPRCHARLPAFRWPTSLRQMLLGGWTCPSCGCEVDRNGVARPMTESP
jgi:hypothetical protein